MKKGLNAFFFINIALLATAFVNYKGFLQISSPYFALGLYFYVFLYMPGYFLAKYFFKKSETGVWEMIPISLCAGFLFFTPLEIVAYLVKMPVKEFLLIYFVILAAWLAANSFMTTGDEGNAGYRKLDLDGWQKAGLFTILAVSTIMMDYYGGFISGNFLAHMSAIRKLAEIGVFEQRNYYFKEYLVNPNIFNGYYVFFASIAWVTKIEPVKIWIYFPQFILPVGLIANFYFAGRVFKSDRYALLYLLFYTLYYVIYNQNPPGDGYAWSQSEVSACNNFLGIGIFLPVISSLVIECVEKVNLRFLIFLALALTAQATIHLYSQIQTYFLAFSFIIFILLVRPRFASVPAAKKIIYFLALGLIPFFVFYFMLMPTINPIYKVVGGTGGTRVLFFGKIWPLVDPLVSNLRDPFTISATVLVLLTLWFVKSDLAAIYTFSIFFFYYFIHFNPAVLYIGGKVHPGYERITRIFDVIPFALPLVFPFYIADKNKLMRSLRPVFIIAVSGTMLMLAKDIPARLKKIVYTKEFSLEQLDKSGNFYGAIRKVIPIGSTVMVNTPLTTWWTTYFSHYIVAHAFDFVLPPNIDQTKRKEDVGYFYKNPIDERSLAILNNYKVEYVFFLDSDLVNKNVEKFPEFELAYHSNGFAIYKLKTPGK